MITEEQGVTTISKSQPTAEGALQGTDLKTVQPDLNTTRQIKDLEVLQQPQEAAQPIEGTETAGLFSRGSKEMLKVYRGLFIKDLEKKMQPPKKYIQEKEVEELASFEDV